MICIIGYYILIFKYLYGKSFLEMSKTINQNILKGCYNATFKTYFKITVRGWGFQEGTLGLYTTSWIRVFQRNFYSWHLVLLYIYYIIQYFIMTNQSDR